MTGVTVVVLNDCPEINLRGFVGEVVESVGYKQLVHFRVKIENKTEFAWVATRHLRRIENEGAA
jgi:hypothetical protein